MTSAAYAPIVLGLAMLVYVVFGFLRRSTRDPRREQEQLRETDRRITEIEREAAAERRDGEG